METYLKLLDNNKAWAAQKVIDDPAFFTRLVNVQAPEFLWIGCSDSRVPANEVTGTLPGQIFVHRNIANMVVSTDLNLLSVVEYAVDVLKVKHVIVCGHYGCGGVKAAMGDRSIGMIDTWLRNIKTVYRLHKAEVDALTDTEARMDRMVDLNVIEQVNNLSKTTIIQRAWNQRGGPHLHGWVYRLSDGIVKPLIELTATAEMDPIDKYSNLG